MPAPTSYTEAQLKDYVVVVLSTVGAALGWTAATAQVTEAVYDALYAYGPTDNTVTPPLYDLTQMTDMPKLRVFVRREAWKHAVNATAAGYDFNADGQNLKRSQLHAQAERRYAAACEESLAYDTLANLITGASLVPATKPYAAENTQSELG